MVTGGASCTPCYLNRISVFWQLQPVHFSVITENDKLKLIKNLLTLYLPYYNIDS